MEDWIRECEKLIDGHNKKEVLHSIMKVLSKYGFVDDDWWAESDGYFDE